jgi:hypothetical protein
MIRLCSSYRKLLDARLTLRPGARHLRKVLSCLFILETLLCIQGCAKPYGTALRLYSEAPDCCASPAELPVELLRQGDKKSFDLDAGSPAYRFNSGKSYFRAFSLPQGPYPYRVTVRSYIIGDNLKSAYIFYPQLITLDANRKLVRSTGPETFTLQRAGYFETAQETAGLQYKLEGGLNFTDNSRDERFLVVLTTDQLLKEKTSVSTTRDEPMLNFITVTSEMGEAQVPHAPAGRVSISVSPLITEPPAAGRQEVAFGGAMHEPSPNSPPEFVAVRLASGKMIGVLELGRTTEASARNLFENAGAGLGRERQNSATFSIGAVAVKPKRLFAPPGSSYQLYFDDQMSLVLLVDEAPADLPRSGREFMRRFPGARESGRTLSSYEVQAPLTNCVTLIAVFRATSDTLESAAYGYGCQVK